MDKTVKSSSFRSIKEAIELQLPIKELLPVKVSPHLLGTPSQVLKDDFLSPY